MKKILSIFMCLLLNVSLAACGNETPSEDTVTETLPQESAAVPVITLDDIVSYSLVRSEEASADLISSASDLYRKLREISTDITFKDDYYREDLPDYAMGDYEILVGETNRSESTAFIETLRTEDYGYVLQNNKIIIAGATDEYTIKAVSLFVRNVLDGDMSDGIFYSAEDDTIEIGSYPLDSLTIGETPIRNYTIVYPENGDSSELLCAERLVSAIADVTGYRLEPVPDSEVEQDYEILVGMTNRTTAYPNLADDESYIGIRDTTVQLGGNSVTALLNAVNELTGMFEPKAKTITLDLAEDNICAFDTTVMTAMSFNVLCSKMEKTRIERVCQIIKNYMPDTFGVQEATPEWMRLLDREFGDLYGYVGEGRDGGDSGEYSAIFYNKSLFSVLDSGTKWLSDTPDKVSKVEESSLNRIFTYALLERIADGMQIMVVNTHFEHTSDEARDRQAEVLADFLDDYTVEYPLILTGDFNTTYGTNAYSTILDSGMTDSGEIAGTASPASTFTNFGAASTIIDFIFVTEGSVTVNDYRVCNEKIDGDFPSDHHPVLIEYVPVG